MRRTARATVLSVAALAVLLPGAAPAGPKMVSQAKQAGLPAQNCQYCHTAALPKKETFKPDDLNERGKWLVEEKRKRGTAEPDAAWLKGYTGK